MSEVDTSATLISFQAFFETSSYYQNVYTDCR